MKVLNAVQSIGLPDGIVAAGFVRNAVWDFLYGIETPLNDIDVIYFCESDISEEKDLMLEHQLFELEPDFPWSVKNQARMHIRNGDAPYKHCLNAMNFWPEKQTAVGAYLNPLNDLEIISSFNLSLLFNGEIEYNPARSLDVFNKRVTSKKWLTNWPLLKVKTSTLCTQ
ncbi:nucleotidyltransferase family protein [Reinekea marina]|nr:nucleotidyltransferase family protein [Reinekea marina]MDN3649067.1 nucleotidyltransferase family protein [Reinekea marina]